MIICSRPLRQTSYVKKLMMLPAFIKLQWSLYAQYFRRTGCICETTVPTLCLKRGGVAEAWSRVI